MRFYKSRSERMGVQKKKTEEEEQGFLNFFFGNEPVEEMGEQDPENKRKGICGLCSKYYSPSCVRCSMFYSPLQDAPPEPESRETVRNRVQQLVGGKEEEEKKSVEGERVTNQVQQILVGGGKGEEEEMSAEGKGKRREKEGEKGREEKEGTKGEEGERNERYHTDPTFSSFPLQVSYREGRKMTMEVRSWKVVRKEKKEEGEKERLVLSKERIG